MDLCTKDGEGNSPFHIASTLTDTQLLEYLLDSSGEESNTALNLQRQDGYTPLHLAMANPHRGFRNAVLMKLTVGILDATIRNADGNTALHSAAKSQDDCAVP